MLGFGSISESPISSLNAEGNFGRIRTLIRVVSAAFGRVLVLGSGSGIIRIGSGSSGVQANYKLYATTTPYTYISQDAQGNRFFVTINPDTFVSEECPTPGIATTDPYAYSSVDGSKNQLTADRSADTYTGSGDETGRKASSEPDIYVRPIQPYKFRV
jgi:hypothetical protein